MNCELLNRELRKIKKQPLRILLHLGVIAALLLNAYFFTIHESYRDEAQAWLIARDTNPVSIFQVLSYEGHPFLWYYLLMPFAKLGFPYETVKIISTVLMAAVILMIGYKSPFSVPVRLCIILSGMCLYRYASFGRSYSLYAFLTIMICCLYKSRHNKPLRYLLLISALIQTHILAIGFAFGLCVSWLCEELAQIKRSGASGKTLFQRLSPLLIPFLSALFLLVEFHDVRNAAANQINRDGILGVIIPTVKSCAENLMGNAAPWFAALFILHAILLLIWYRRGLGYLMVLLAGWAAGLGIFIMSVSPADYRAVTMAYMLIGYLWYLKEGILQDRGKLPVFPRADPLGFLFRILSTAMIVVLVLGIGQRMSKELGRDINFLYTDAGNTAAAVDSLPGDSVILECGEDICNTVIPRLRQNTVINPFSDKPASYITRNTELTHSMYYTKFMDYCRSRFPEKQEVYLLYCKGACKIRDFSAEGLDIVYQTSDQIMTGEVFTIYMIPIDETEDSDADL